MENLSNLTKIALEVSEISYDAHKSSATPGNNSRDRVTNALTTKKQFTIVKDFSIHATNQDTILLVDNKREGHSGNVYVGCRGTVLRGEFLRDFLWNDIRATITGGSTRLRTTQTMVEDAIALAKETKGDVYIIGHSLGGMLAKSLGIMYGVKFITVNAPDISLHAPQALGYRANSTLERWVGYLSGQRRLFSGQGIEIRESSDSISNYCKDFARYVVNVDRCCEERGIQQVTFNFGTEHSISDLHQAFISQSQSEENISAPLFAPYTASQETQNGVDRPMHSNIACDLAIDGSALLDKNSSMSDQQVSTDTKKSLIQEILVDNPTRVAAAITAQMIADNLLANGVDPKQAFATATEAYSKCVIGDLFDRALQKVTSLPSSVSGSIAGGVTDISMMVMRGGSFAAIGMRGLEIGVGEVISSVCALPISIRVQSQESACKGFGKGLYQSSSQRCEVNGNFKGATLGVHFEKSVINYFRDDMILSRHQAGIGAHGRVPGVKLSVGLYNVHERAQSRTYLTKDEKEKITLDYERNAIGQIVTRLNIGGRELISDGHLGFLTCMLGLDSAFKSTEIRTMSRAKADGSEYHERNYADKQDVNHNEKIFKYETQQTINRKWFGLSKTANIKKFQSGQHTSTSIISNDVKLDDGQRIEVTTTKAITKEFCDLLEDANLKRNLKKAKSIKRFKEGEIRKEESLFEVFTTTTIESNEDGSNINAPRESIEPNMAGGDTRIVENDLSRRTVETDLIDVRNGFSKKTVNNFIAGDKTVTVDFQNNDIDTIRNDSATRVTGKIGGSKTWNSEYCDQIVVSGVGVEPRSRVADNIYRKESELNADLYFTDSKTGTFGHLEYKEAAATAPGDLGTWEGRFASVHSVNKPECGYSAAMETKGTFTKIDSSPNDTSYADDKVTEVNPDVISNQLFDASKGSMSTFAIVNVPTHHQIELVGLDAEYKKAEIIDKVEPAGHQVYKQKKVTTGNVKADKTTLQDTYTYESSSVTEVSTKDCIKTSDMKTVLMHQHSSVIRKGKGVGEVKYTRDEHTDKTVCAGTEREEYKEFSQKFSERKEFSSTNIFNRVIDSITEITNKEGSVTRSICDDGNNIVTDDNVSSLKYSIASKRVEEGLFYNNVTESWQSSEVEGVNIKNTTEASVHSKAAAISMLNDSINGLVGINNLSATDIALRGFAVGAQSAATQVVEHTLRYPSSTLDALKTHTESVVSSVETAIKQAVGTDAVNSISNLGSKTSELINDHLISPVNSLVKVGNDFAGKTVDAGKKVIVDCGLDKPLMSIAEPVVQKGKDVVEIISNITEVVGDKAISLGAGALVDAVVDGKLDTIIQNTGERAFDMAINAGLQHCMEGCLPVTVSRESYSTSRSFSGAERHAVKNQSNIQATIPSTYVVKVGVHSETSAIIYEDGSRMSTNTAGVHAGIASVSAGLGFGVVDRESAITTTTLPSGEVESRSESSRDIGALVLDARVGTAAGSLASRGLLGGSISVSKVVRKADNTPYYMRDPAVVLPRAVEPSDNFTISVPRPTGTNSYLSNAQQAIKEAIEQPSELVKGKISTIEYGRIGFFGGLYHSETRTHGEEIARCTSTCDRFASAVDSNGATIIEAVTTQTVDAIREQQSSECEGTTLLLYHHNKVTKTFAPNEKRDLISREQTHIKQTIRGNANNNPLESQIRHVEPGITEQSSVMLVKDVEIKPATSVETREAYTETTKEIVATTTLKEIESKTESNENGLCWNTRKFDHVQGEVVIDRLHKKKAESLKQTEGKPADNEQSQANIGPLAETTRVYTQPLVDYTVEELDAKGIFAATKTIKTDMLNTSTGSVETKTTSTRRLTQAGTNLGSAVGSKLGCILSDFIEGKQINPTEVGHDAVCKVLESSCDGVAQELIDLNQFSRNGETVGVVGNALAFRALSSLFANLYKRVLERHRDGGLAPESADHAGGQGAPLDASTIPPTQCQLNVNQSDDEALLLQISTQDVCNVCIDTLPVIVQALPFAQYTSQLVSNASRVYEVAQCAYNYHTMARDSEQNLIADGLKLAEVVTKTAVTAAASSAVVRLVEKGFQKAISNESSLTMLALKTVVQGAAVACAGRYVTSAISSWFDYCRRRSNLRQTVINLSAQFDVSPNASPKEVAAIWRKRAYQYHPDVVPGREEEFKIMSALSKKLVAAKEEYDAPRNGYSDFIAVFTEASGENGVIPSLQSLLRALYLCGSNML